MGLEAAERLQERSEIVLPSDLPSEQRLAGWVASLLAEQNEVREELRRLRQRVEELENRGGDTPRPAENPDEERAWSWRQSHADEFRALAGRYVAWGAQGIVASAEDYSALLEELSKQGNPRGLGIEYVPKGPRVRR